MALRKIELSSSAMVYTPGLLFLAKHTYPNDRPLAIRFFTDGYGLPEAVVDGLLSGAIEHEIEGESVKFEAEFPDDWEEVEGE